MALSGGHVEYVEDPRYAAVREVFEETGLCVEVTKCQGWYLEPYQDCPGPMVGFVFVAKTVGGQLVGSSEGKVAVYPESGFPPISEKRKGSRRKWAAYSLPSVK